MAHVLPGLEALSLEILIDFDLLCKDDQIVQALQTDQLFLTCTKHGRPQWHGVLRDKFNLLLSTPLQGESHAHHCVVTWRSHQCHIDPHALRRLLGPTP